MERGIYRITGSVEAGVLAPGRGGWSGSSDVIIHHSVSGSIIFVRSSSDDFTQRWNTYDPNAPVATVSEAPNVILSMFQSRAVSISNTYDDTIFMTFRPDFTAFGSVTDLELRLTVVARNFKASLPGSAGSFDVYMGGTDGTGSRMLQPSTSPERGTSVVTQSLPATTGSASEYTFVIPLTNPGPGIVPLRFVLNSGFFTGYSAFFADATLTITGV